MLIPPSPLVISVVVHEFITVCCSPSMCYDDGYDVNDYDDVGIDDDTDDDDDDRSKACRGIRMRHGC